MAKFDTKFFKIFFKKFFSSLNQFDKSTELEFRAFQLPNDIKALRITSIIILLYGCFFTVRDLLSYENKIAILLFRSSMILIFICIYLNSFKPIFKKLSFQKATFLGLILLNIIFYFFNIFFERSIYYQYAFFSLMVFISKIGFGLTFTNASILNLFFYVIAIIYPVFLNKNLEISTYSFANYTAHLLLSTVINYLFERKNRINFHHHNKLLNSNSSLELANATKNKILSLLSHDLKAPLVNLSTLLASNRTQTLEKSEFDLYAEKIKLNLSATTTMLNNLIKWSQTQYEGFKPEFSSINIKQLIDEIILELEIFRDEKKVLITNEIKENIDCFVDKEMIKASFRNIISNSIKYSLPEKMVKIVAYKQKDKVLIEISDEGIGMTETEIETLFSNKLKPKKASMNGLGSGIGLSLTYDFLKMNGGKIEVFSKLNKGSLFKIELNAFAE